MFSKGKSRRSNYHSKRKKIIHSKNQYFLPTKAKRNTFNSKTSTYEYGTLPIHKSDFDDNLHHPHVIVEKNDGYWLSVGIQSSPKSGNHKLKEVYESKGEIGYMHHYVSKAPKSKYYKKPENWHIDVDSEARAKSMVEKYKNKKNKH